MQAIGRTSRRLRLGAVGAAALVCLVAGCSDSDDTDASPSPSASSSPTATGTPAKGSPVDGEKIFRPLTQAMIKAGGVELEARIGDVRVDGRFNLGEADEMGFVSKVTGTGTVVAADGAEAEYRAELGQRFEGAGFLVNDGKPVAGRPWAFVPRNTSTLKDQKKLIAEHPLYLLVPQAIPLVEPDNIATLMSVRKGLIRAADSTPTKYHYLWTLTGKPPVAGAADTYQLWVDGDGLPTRFVGEVRGAPLEATYTGWGDQDLPDAPAEGDTHVLPVEAA